MLTLRPPLPVVLLLLGLRAASLAHAAITPPPAASPNMNLALGRVYRVSDVPVYHYCTGPEDDTDLTDGIVIGGAHAWTKQGMVGWQGVRDAVAVEVDLGRTHALDAVHLSAYWGSGSGCFLPSRVEVSVSDDGRTYHRLARPTPEADQTRGQGRYVFRAESLETRGRYVLLQMSTTGQYLFCDEVVVLAGDHAPGDVRFPDDSAFGFARRLRRPGEFPYPELKGKGRSRAVARTAELTAAARWLVQRAKGCHPHDSEFSRAVTTLEPADAAELEREEFERIRDRVLQLSSDATKRRFGERGTLVWWTNPWAEARAGDVPPRIVDEPRFALRLAADEVVPAALMVTNATEEDLVLGAGLLGEGADPESVTVRIAVFHAHDPEAPDRLTSNPLPRIDALGEPPRVPPGQTRQLWLECDARTLGPGQRDLTVEVTHAGRPVARARLALTVDTADLPPSPIKSMGYDYIGMDWGGLEEGREAWFMEDMAAHGFSHLVLSNHALPRGQFDEQGRLTGPLDVAVIDRALATRNSDMDLIFFLYNGVDRFVRPKIERGAEAWNRAVQTWFGEVAAHLSRRGWSPERVMYYPYDEVGPTTARLLAEEIGLVHTRSPELRFFSTAFRSILGTPGEVEVTKTISYPITWCLSEDSLGRLDAFEGAARRPWSYAVIRQWMDPYESCRLFWWKAVKHRLAGIGFWAFYSTLKPDRSAWKPGYTMVYDGEMAPFATAERVIPSKKWEAWRQGWLDTRHVRLARSRRAGGTDAPDAQINQLVDWVLDDPGDRTRADTARARLKAMGRARTE